jgi:hypothetical protein
MDLYFFDEKQGD